MLDGRWAGSVIRDGDGLDMNDGWMNGSDHVCFAGRC
jgi:hypothetical protein